MTNDRVILHSDMNSFYASVEMMLDPSLKGKAVAVCGATEERHGIVLAKSELAKKAGVKTGMVNWEAKQRCPGLILVPPQYDQYLKYSKLAHQIYYRYTDLVEPFGMDECWLDMTGSSAYGTGMEIAQKIRTACREELGLTVSIGVSFNKIFAKLGSDMKKPDAVTQITREDFREKVWPLAASELIYVGRATEAKLASRGIHTVGELAAVPPEILRSWFGVNGLKLWAYANGTDKSRVMHKDFVSPVKSIGHGITCTADLENEEEVFKVLLELAQDVGHRLRVHELAAQGVQVFVRGNDLLGGQFQCKLPFKTQLPSEIASAGFRIFKERYADTVLTESTVTGIATDKLQEYMYAAELVDVSTDTLTKSMAKQIKSMKAVQDGTKLSVEAYEKLGVQVTNTDGSLRDSDTVYWEVIDALGKVENETERNALAMQILGKSAQELNPLIEAGAERMNELGEQAHAAGYVVSGDMLSAYGALDDQLQYLNVGATAAKNALGTVLLPVLTDLATEGNALLGEFTNGILDANGDISKMSEVIGELLPQVLDMFMEFLPELMEIAGEIVGSLANAIIENLPTIIDTASQIIFMLLQGLIEALPQIAEGALQLVLALVNGILANLPMLLNAALQAVVTLATGIAEALPTLIPTIIQVVVQIVQTLIENLPMILDAALQLITGLAQGVLDALPVLIAALPEIIMGIINFLLDAIPQIIETGIQLITSLVAALPEIITAIVEAIPQIIEGIISAVLGAIPQIIQAGIDLLISLVQALPQIITTIVGAIPDIITGIINAVLNNIPLIIQAGIQLLTSLITNLPTIIVEIVKAIPQIITGIVSALGKGVSQMAEVGVNLVKGLWQGIQSLASWLWDKVSGWISSIWDGICDFFGIASPSKEMGWVGEMLVDGLAGSISANGKDAVKAAEGMSADITDVMHGLAEDMETALPTDFTVDGNIGASVKGAASGVTAPTGLQLVLNIATFNNYTNEDIQQLTNEVMVTAGQFAKRKGVVFA